MVRYNRKFKNDVGIEFDDTPQIIASGKDFNLKLRLKDDSKPVKTEILPSGKLRHQTTNLDLQFYPVDNVFSYNSLSVINVGAVENEKLGALYDLFRKRKQNQPVALIYAPSDESYLLFNMRLAKEQLKKTDNIVRYRAFNNPSPMFVDQNSLIVDFVFPQNNAPINSELFVLSFRETLQSYGVDATFNGARVFIQNKKVCSYVYDYNHFIFYLSLLKPKAGFESQYVKDADKPTYEYAGLKDLIVYDDAFVKMLIAKIAEKHHWSVAERVLTQAEEETVQEISDAYSHKNWAESAETDYEIDFLTEHEDAYEFECVLKAKPSTNVLRFELETSNLQFYYQEKLTHEEIRRGVFRPTDVVGSYAVYKSDMRKVFHIYRPKCIDANGDWCWASLSITENQMLITIPQTFLNSCAYPLTVDPTLGYTTMGATGQQMSSVGALLGWELTATQSGVATSIAICFSSKIGISTDTFRMKGVIYEKGNDPEYTQDVGGYGVCTMRDGYLKGYTETVSNLWTDNVKQWVTMTLTEPVTLIKDKTYLCMLWSDYTIDKAGNTAIYNDSVAGAKHRSTASFLQWGLGTVIPPNLVQFHNSGGGANEIVYISLYINYRTCNTIVRSKSTSGGHSAHSWNEKEQASVTYARQRNFPKRCIHHTTRAGE